MANGNASHKPVLEHFDLNMGLKSQNISKVKTIHPEGISGLGQVPCTLQE